MDAGCVVKTPDFIYVFESKEVCRCFILQKMIMTGGETVIYKSRT